MFFGKTTEKKTHSCFDLYPTWPVNFQVCYFLLPCCRSPDIKTSVRHIFFRGNGLRSSSRAKCKACLGLGGSVFADPNPLEALVFFKCRFTFFKVTTIEGNTFDTNSKWKMTPRKMLGFFVFVFESEVHLFSWEKELKRDAPSWTTFWNFGSWIRWSVGFVFSIVLKFVMLRGVILGRCIWVHWTGNEQNWIYNRKENRSK